MRSYLVVMDETEEALAALRYAARRAARTGGGVEILALIPQQEFVQWGAVQEAMEEEARLRAEAMLVQATGAIMEEAGIKPVDHGPAGRSDQGGRRAAEGARRHRRSGAGRRGRRRARARWSAISPATAAGSLPCPLIIVPGGLSDEALARLT